MTKHIEATLEQNTTFTYSWRRSGGTGSIKPEHIPILEAAAVNTITGRLRYNYRNGRLSRTLRDDSVSPARPVAYTGKWHVVGVTLRPQTTEMGLCEVSHIHLRPNQPYVFVAIDGCKACAAAAAVYAEA